MSSTPKWYCRNKGQTSMQGPFAELSKLANELRRITKRIVIDVKVDIFSEHDSILDECEKIVEGYWRLKDQERTKEFLGLTKKIKRSPYNALLILKYNKLMQLNDQRFYQLTFVLKRTLSYLLRKSMQSEVWLNWALQITHLYNKCLKKLPTDAQRKADPDEEEEVEDEKGPNMNANICSNLYPALLLNPKSIDFAYVLQLVSQSRVEQNSLDLMFGLFNMVEPENMAGPSENAENIESTCSSLEILRILTLNLTNDGEFQQYYDDNDRSGGEYETGVGFHSQRNRHTQHFLAKERAFIGQLIARASDLSPSIFDGDSNFNMKNYITKGLRLIWSYVGIILDHIILWWIDTPISCYPLAHVDSIRHWLQIQSVTDIPEPVFSTLRGIGEILSNFVCNNIWDQLFRLTLISEKSSRETVDIVVKQYKGAPANENGTPTGTVWITVFSNLINLSNNYFSHVDVENCSSLPIAEQIPILHRIDHSVHSMRLWVMEQAKQLCDEWSMDCFFKILDFDVKTCLEVFATIKLPKLTADLRDILMLVCVALRTKLVCEVTANIDKLKKTTEECVQILSAVCRLLSLANLSLVFPSAAYWQQANFNNDEKSVYVIFLLDQIYLPAIKATRNLVILKLILKLICEAWLDYIYERRIKFSVNGAVRLLNDFDDVREWILACPLLDEEQLDKLSNHEVLRMCKGVGKILLRKPEDVIAITQSPKYDKSSSRNESGMEETQLPSEMFVSNQKHWLQLRAGATSFPLVFLCCGDTDF